MLKIAFSFIFKNVVWMKMACKGLRDGAIGKGLEMGEKMEGNNHFWMGLFWCLQFKTI